MCHMIVVVFLLYSFIFHSYSETTATVGSAIALLYNDLLMMLTVGNGILVNHAVSLLIMSCRLGFDSLYIIVSKKAAI